MALALAWTLAAGCGGSGSLRAENDQLSDQLRALRADSRRQRQKARDLENQLFLLADRLETARVERDRARGVDIVLPVEVREPGDDAGGSDAGEPDLSDPPGGGGEERYEVVGVDADGNEIVYAGEASLDRSVAPRYRPVPRAPSDYDPDGEHGHDTASRAPVPARSAERATVPRRHDRLPVTDGAGPTVAEQIRRARPPARRVEPERRPEPRVEPAAPPRLVADDAAPRAEYQRLYAALRAGDHDAAIAGFRQFVRDHADHDYADNAQYWLGEAYYDRRDYAAALVEFRRVVTRFPRGNKVPDALLKIGYCYLAMGEPAKARQVLSQVIEIYPKSSPARLARERLQALSPEGSP